MSNIDKSQNFGNMKVSVLCFWAGIYAMQINAQCFRLSCLFVALQNRLGQTSGCLPLTPYVTQPNCLHNERIILCSVLQNDATLFLLSADSVPLLRHRNSAEDAIFN